MKIYKFLILLIILLALRLEAAGIPEEYYNSFVLICELGPTGKFGDFRPIGTGSIIEIEDCFNEIYLITSPRNIEGRDSIFMLYYYWAIDDNQGAHEVRLIQDNKQVWTKLDNDSIHVAIVPLISLWSAGVVAIDTSEIIPITSFSIGEQVSFLEFDSSFTFKQSWGIDLEGIWSFPLARQGILSLLPGAFSHYENEPNSSQVYYIDGIFRPGVVCSPVIATSQIMNNKIKVIGFINGNSNVKLKNSHLISVIPKEVIIKLLNVYHGCE
jgi:hypothetical protein